MTEPAPPTAAVIRAWARLVKARRVLLSTVEAELKSAGFPPLEWYDVLLELSRVAAPGLRPSELETHLLLEQYNLSRLLDRMVKAGYLERSPSPEDARGHYLALSASGRDLLTRMWPVYREAIGRHVGSKLTEAEAQQLGSALGKLLEGES
jgi:DNA-binding MarR family transcriptional regulator